MATWKLFLMLTVSALLGAFLQDIFSATSSSRGVVAQRQVMTQRDLQQRVDRIVRASNHNWRSRTLQEPTGSRPVRPGPADPDADSDDNNGRDEPEHVNFSALLRAEREKTSQRLQAIDNEFRSESVDGAWAQLAEARIAQALQQRDYPFVTETSIVCRTTLCMIELELESDRDVGQVSSHLAVEDLPRGFIVHEGRDTEGPYRTRMYFARTGHSLPHGYRKEI